MLKKIGLLVNTIKYLRPIQVVYQIFYRIKPARKLSNYASRSTILEKPCFLSFSRSPFLDTNVTADQKFEFLNRTKYFNDHINWDFQEYGKLWNYNLQYFNFLNNRELTQDLKISWLLDIGEWLRNGRLKLEPYPVSLRIINTIRFLSENKITDKQLLTDLKAQFTYLSKHLEFHLLGNHLLENAFSLFMGGYFYNSSSMRNKAKRILYEQLEEQILNDGCHFELSPMYHQIIYLRILELIDWYSKINDDVIFFEFLSKIAIKMGLFLNKITFSNGDIPHFNDSTNGIVPNSEKLFNYAKSLGLNFPSSVKLSDSGFRKFDNFNYECVVDIGKIGPSYQPGHSHADALSFILYHNKLPLLVEVGTSTYQIGEKRNFERSTNAHNTVVIKHTNQSQVWGGFRVGKRANVKVLEDEKSKLIANHDGYLNNFGVFHQRSFQFFDEMISIIDEIGMQRGSANFHFYPKCKVDVVNENTVLIGGRAQLNFENSNSIITENYEYSYGYNKYEEAIKVIVTFDNLLKTQISLFK